MRFMVQSKLQMLAELGRGVIHEGIGELGGECVAGVVRTDEPFSHGQSLYAGSCYNITCAGVHKNLHSTHGSL